MVDHELSSFEDIFPFVRHVHLSGIEPFIQSTLLKAYDHRLIYIYNGKGHIIVDGVKYLVSKGNLLYWKPGLEYLIHSDESDHLTIIGINFDFTHARSDMSYPIPPDKSKDFNEADITETIYFYDVEVFNKSFYLKDTKTLESYLIEINSEYLSKKRFYNQRVSGLFLSVVGILSRYVTTSYTKLDASFNTIDIILKFIHENYSNPINNEVIGEELSYHPNHINRLMVMHTGISLHQYLINYRLSKAINLMRTTNKTISEIASSVGFQNANYFSKIFKNKTGESPRSFISHSLGHI